MVKPSRQHLLKLCENKGINRQTVLQHIKNKKEDLLYVKCGLKTSKNNKIASISNIVKNFKNEYVIINDKLVKNPNPIKKSDKYDSLKPNTKKSKSMTIKEKNILKKIGLKHEIKKQLKNANESEPPLTKKKNPTKVKSLSQSQIKKENDLRRKRQEKVNAEVDKTKGMLERKGFGKIAVDKIIEKLKRETKITDGIKLKAFKTLRDRYLSMFKIPTPKMRLFLSNKIRRRLWDLDLMVTNKVILKHKNGRNIEIQRRLKAFSDPKYATKIERALYAKSLDFTNPSQYYRNMYSSVLKQETLEGMMQVAKGNIVMETKKIEKVPQKHSQCLFAQARLNKLPDPCTIPQWIKDAMKDNSKTNNKSGIEYDRNSYEQSLVDRFA